MTRPTIVECHDRYRSTFDHAGVDIRGTRLGIDCHLDEREWRLLRADIKAGKYDDLYPDERVQCTDPECANANPQPLAHAERPPRRFPDA